jgi:hypothetical protein
VLPSQANPSKRPGQIDRAKAPVHVVLMMFPFQDVGCAEKLDQLSRRFERPVALKNLLAH